MHSPYCVALAQSLLQPHRTQDEPATQPHRTQNWGIDSSEEEDDSSSSRGTVGGNSATPSLAGSSEDTATAAQLQQQYTLAHTKPGKASILQVVLKLRQLSGYDQRHSLQKDLMQTGVPLELAAKLASHTVDETKRYAANTCYELSDSSAMPIKLVSIISKTAACSECRYPSHMSHLRKAPHTPEFPNTAQSCVQACLLLYSCLLFVQICYL